MWLDQDVDYVGVLIHCALQVLPLIRMKTSSKYQWSPSRPSRRFNFRA